MKNAKVILPILLLISLTLGSLIVFYYWKADDLIAIKFVPINIMILVLIYIVSQFFKRVLTKAQNWWDWLYYIGLITIALPVFIANDTNFSWLLPLTQIGVLFLVLPVMLEGYNIVKLRKA